VPAPWDIGGRARTEPRAGSARRRLLAGLAALLCLLGARSGPLRAQVSRPSVYVYLHTETKSSSLEKTLRQQLPGLEVTVFGRFRDFEEAIARHKPDAVLALQPMLATLSLPPALQGTRGDRDWEPYVLLSEEGAPDGGPAARVVGVVDLLGRTGTQQLVIKLLGNATVELRRVTKLEDLLPLLQFSAAQAVLVPGSAAKSISERSRLRLRVHNLPEARVGLPALGLWSADKRALILEQVQGLDASTLRMLGVDRWRAR
jgi:hypothetical protein